jgi:hypothetical protein
LFLVIGLSAMFFAREYPMGTGTRMGPGYFPTVLGGLLALIGAVVLVRSLMKPGEPISRFAFKPLAIVLGSTALFGVLARGAGLLLSTALLVVLSARASKKFKWPATLALAAGTAVFSVLVFVKALGLPLQAVGPWLSR